jgi:hypothetical protein
VSFEVKRLPQDVDEAFADQPANGTAVASRA